MEILKSRCQRLVDNRAFNLVITVIILLNAALVGVASYTADDSAIESVQRVILWLFTAELALRFLAAKNSRAFFADGWNLFDLVLVFLGYTPEVLFAGSQQFVIFRVLRVIRILRLLRISGEVKLIAAVLIKSMRSLLYNGLFFFVFMYLFANIGHILFKLPEAGTLPPEKQAIYKEFAQVDPNGFTCTDPYGSLTESMFTLFRVMTGDDWTAVRYSLLQARKYELIAPSHAVITTFHVIWFSLAAFLLLNLLVGAVVNNYQIIMDDIKAQRDKKAGPGPATA
jgi:voltage-gated sodium channel